MRSTLLSRYRRRVHLVDRCLLLMMLILLLQSTISLFLSGADVHAATSVDVVIRTASAAIFGYLLGGNFGLTSSEVGQAQSALPQHMLEESAQSGAPSPEIQARIGFAAEELPPETTQIAAPPAIRDIGSVSSAGVQIRVAAGIGIFCLVALLILRNLMEFGVIAELSESANATVIQFRDFVSGCVGFLIGSPTHSAQSNS